MYKASTWSTGGHEPYTGSQGAGWVQRAFAVPDLMGSLSLLGCVHATQPSNNVYLDLAPKHRCSLAVGTVQVVAFAACIASAAAAGIYTLACVLQQVRG